MIRLNIHYQGETEERIFQGESVSVGRSRSCDITFQECGYLSRRHCVIDLVDGHAEVRDMSSRNGIRVNDIVLQKGVVEVGDVIRIGDVQIELLEVGRDDPEPEQVRPCLECGFLMPVNELACPRCSGSVMIKRRSKINREHIPGYELQRKIGAGGMGIVFKARRKSDDRATAIKILKPHLARDPSYLVRFVEETRVLTLLKHPNIVQIYGRGSDNGLTYIDMEFVEGDSVRHLIRKRGRLDERQALQIVWDVVLALDFAAKKHVIHGDVKPSNFLIDDRGATKLCDFGLARLFKYFVPGGPGFSPESSGRKGTAAYAAPERFGETSKPTVPGDIYSMGVSLFQMVTGELPFGSNKDARAPVDRTSVPDPTLFNPDLRPATCMLIERMMKYHERDRYPGYRELQDDLALLLS